MKQHKAKKVMWTTLGVLSALVVFSMLGLSFSVSKIAEEMIAWGPESWLASNDALDGTNVRLAISYWDQKQDECVNLYDKSLVHELRTRQFEWTSCGYDYKGIEQGLVKYELDENYLPVGVSGEMVANRGMNDISRWFTAVEGKSKEYAGTLKLNYRAEAAEFSYENNEFYPLDKIEFSDGDAANKDGHNHLFTMSFGVPFTVAANGREKLSITADDDTFVYLGKKLVIDMGGVHGATRAEFEIRDDGTVFVNVDGRGMEYSGVKLESGESSVIRIFHADRDAKDSVFSIKLSGINLNVMSEGVAGTDGVQIAYDPNDPSYVAPLGESMTVRPDGTRGYVIMMMVFGALIVVFATFVARLAAKEIKKY